MQLLVLCNRGALPREPQVLASGYGGAYVFKILDRFRSIKIDAENHVSQRAGVSVSDGGHVLAPTFRRIAVQLRGKLADKILVRRFIYSDALLCQCNSEFRGVLLQFTTRHIRGGSNLLF